MTACRAAALMCAVAGSFVSPPADHPAPRLIDVPYANAIIRWNGALAAGTPRGLWLWSPAKRKPTKLTGEFVTGLATDSSGGMWASTWMSDGLLRIDPNRHVTTIGYPKMVPYDRSLVRMNDVAVAGSMVWVATDGGVFGYDMASGLWRTTRTEMLADRVLTNGSGSWCLCVDENEGDQTRLIDPSGKRTTELPDGLGEPSSNLAEDATGLWFAATSDVFRYEVASKRLDRFDGPQMVEKADVEVGVTWVAPIRDGVLLAVGALDSGVPTWKPPLHGGVYLLNTKTGRLTQLGDAQTRRLTDNCRCLLPDGKGVWVGTSRGLVRLSLPAK